LTKTIETLVEDINNLFTQGHTLEDAAADYVAFKMAGTLRDRLAEVSKDREPTLRMSNIGRPVCQLWHELHKSPKEDLPPEVRIKFLYGNLLEDMILFLAAEAGHEVTRVQEEISVDGVVGHIDAFIDGVLVDVKSASSRAFQKFETGSLRDDDPFGYIAQLAGYKKALAVPRAGFLAIDKTLGKICFLEVTENYDVSGRIKEVRAAVDSETFIGRCFEDVPEGKSGNRKLPTQCSYCGYRDECWKDSNEGAGLKTFYYAKGPVYLTHVSRQPKVFEINPDYKEKQ